MREIAQVLRMRRLAPTPTPRTRAESFFDT
jgi:hypothetical protein